MHGALVNCKFEGEHCGIYVVILFAGVFRAYITEDYVFVVIER